LIGSGLLKSLLWVSRRYWLPYSGFYLANVVLSLLGPILVNQFVSRLQSGLPSVAELWLSVFFGLGIGISGMVAGLCMQQYFFFQIRRIQMFVNVINTKVFRHALNLSKGARERTAIGDIVNHLSTDTDAISEVGGAVNDLAYCILMISGAVGLLFYYLGSTAWVAVVLLSILIPISKKVSRDFTRFDEQLMKRRDERVSLMSQILSAIRLVKYFAWESSVSDEVAQIRRHELVSRRRIAQAELMVTLLYVSVGTLVLFAVFAVHVWRGGSMDPALVFTCVSLFSLLEDPFAFISRVVSQFISAKVAADRIAQFLRQEQNPMVRGATKGVRKSVGLAVEQLTVQLLSSERPQLHKINFELQPGQSLAVVGGVGSGKSTLLHALLGEVASSAGGLRLFDDQTPTLSDARIGYVPQEAYILNTSLRENLTFGQSEFSEAQVLRALELAGLKQDVEQMPGGLQAEVGEKGVNFSGGQRQRLSLARAVLHDPQIVLLDDPLSAVDPNTETYLVENLLFGEWQSKTRLVVTHRLTHLQRFDRILFLEEGQARGFGTYAELKASCAEFRHYLHEFERTTLSSSPEHSSGDASLALEPARITDDEEREFGAVRGGVYWDYVLSLCGQRQGWRWGIFALLALSAASGTALPLLQKAWLALVTNSQTQSHLVLNNVTVTAWAHHPLSAIYVYGGLGLLVLVGALCADLFWLKRGLIAGRDIHDRMLKSVLGAPIRFFDATPVGRILQRFSRDMESIDIQLQWHFEQSMKCLAQVVVILSMILVLLPWLALVIVPVMIIYYRVQSLYRSSAREAKRLDSIARSPRYAHFKETLQGLMVIRAFGQREWFMNEFFTRLSQSQRMFHGHFLINRWFSSRIPVVGGLVSLCTALGIVLSVHRGTISPGTAGMLTVYSLSFWGVLNWGIRIWAEVEARMTSMERVKFYSQLPQETQEEDSAYPVPSDWPSRGEVQVVNLCVRYAPHLPQVIKDLSFSLPAGERMGLIGRTGSGKSTVFQALYRLIEAEHGRILIDGIDIRRVPLKRLRQALAIIPQDPTLFMGSLRSNLDRYQTFSDAQLWQVLERTCLADFVRSQNQGLLLHVHENGANLSQGQRQLLCLARALLLRAKVIILDEATASVDVKTDAQVQQIIRESCAGVTMLIIAHRLATVRDCDQILELADGRKRRLLRPSGAEAGHHLGEFHAADRFI
jgi:ABC-type multidrug transport system fused ATPase/permease subunit